MSKGEVRASVRGAVVSLAKRGARVSKGDEVALLEAMKMHHALVAPCDGTVAEVLAKPNEVVDEGAVLLRLTPAARGAAARAAKRAAAKPKARASSARASSARASSSARADLQELERARAQTLDAARPAAMKKRKARGRSARENVADLCDKDSFLEYGQLTFAAQRRRRSLEDLRANTPADGMVAGIGSVNGKDFSEERARCAVLAYDYTVLAGTQGAFNHKKTDRVLGLAEKWQLPVVFFTEGGGGRPGDTDVTDIQVASLDVMTFATFARMSGRVPRIAVNHGFCFAGNAVIFGSADITVATEQSFIGMGGPAMIAGGGLGEHAATAVGPMEVQTKNGVVDVLAKDERDAVALTRQLLSYFQGALPTSKAQPQRLLRDIIPEDRQRIYDMRELITQLVDTGSFLELRRDYGVGMITGFARVQGKPLGVFANNPAHLGGAIDAAAAEKAGRFFQLCDDFGLPLLSLCDTPGFMVGPKHEHEATVRRASRMMVTGASLSVPVMMVCVRKAYGLGAQAMGMGSLACPEFTIAWPTGEFGAMGLEGAVELGFRKELEAQASPEARRALYDKLVAASYEKGKALSAASVLEIDAVIDPQDTRAWITRGLQSHTARGRAPKPRPFIDTW